MLQQPLDLPCLDLPCLDLPCLAEPFHSPCRAARPCAEPKSPSTTRSSPAGPAATPLGPARLRAHVVFRETACQQALPSEGGVTSLLALPRPDGRCVAQRRAALPETQSCIADARGTRRVRPTPRFEYEIRPRARPQHRARLCGAYPAHYGVNDIMICAPPPPSGWRNSPGPSGLFGHAVEETIRSLAGSMLDGSGAESRPGWW